MQDPTTGRLGDDLDEDGVVALGAIGSDVLGAGWLDLAVLVDGSNVDAVHPRRRAPVGLPLDQDSSEPGTARSQARGPSSMEISTAWMRTGDQATPAIGVVPAVIRRGAGGRRCARRFHRAVFGPAEIDPVPVERFPGGEVDLLDPFGGGDVAVEAGDHEPGGKAVADLERFPILPDSIVRPS